MSKSVNVWAELLLNELNKFVNAYEERVRGKIDKIIDENGHFYSKDTIIERSENESYIYYHVSKVSEPYIKTIRYHK